MHISINSFIMKVKNKCHSLAILILLFLVPNLVYCLDPAIKYKIDKIVNENFLQTSHFPGFGLSVVSGNGEEVYANGYGFHDVENSINATKYTKFAIGSISKSFTAVLVVKTLSELYPEKGEAVLDTPIRKLHPASNFTLSDRYRSESTTFRDMLSHRTCIESEGWGLIMSGSFKDMKEYIFRQRFAAESCSFRTDYEYNNGIFAHTGEIIAAMANSTLVDMFKKLFEEIGMSNSVIIGRSDDYDKMTNMSRSYYRKDGQTHRFNNELLKRIVATGSGAIISTPDDMAKYLTFHLNKGKVGQKQIVSQEAMSWTVKSAIPVKDSLTFKTKKDDIISGDYGYGLGVSLGIYDGWQMVSHAGYISPYFSFLSFYPALKIGVFSSSNWPGYADDATDQTYLHHQILNLLTGSNVTEKVGIKNETQETSDQSKVETAKQKFLDEISLKNSSNLEVTQENMTGVFGSPQSGDILITNIVNGTSSRLYFRAGEWSTGWLNKLPTSNSTFSLEWDSDVVHEMYAADETGGGRLYDFLLDFSDINKPVGFFEGMIIVFERDLTMDKFPNHPWEPDSCGPNEIMRMSNGLFHLHLDYGIVIFTVISNLIVF